MSRQPNHPPARRSPARVEAFEPRTMMSAAADAAAAVVLHPDAIYVRPARTAAAVTSTTIDQVDGYTPAQIRTAYGFAGVTFSGGAVAADGTGQTIALVDAYNDPNIAADLAVFDDQFGIAAPPSLKVVNQTGGATLPATDADWSGEIALDVEWAHAIAPGADLLLVEANTDSTDNLLAGVNYARSAKNVSVVSMSWGGSEYESWGGGGESASQTTYDTDFTTPAGHRNVTFVAAAGDSGQQAGVQWPASSSNVLSVGGTTLIAADDGTYESEAGWAGTSSGISTVETEPAYQQAVNTSGFRAVADVSYDGDADHGFKVYDSVPDADDGTTYVGWGEVGGTSAGSPQWAGLVAIADQGRVLANLATLDGPTQTLPDLYALYASPTSGGYDTYTSYFNDVTTGGSGGADFHHDRGGTSANSAAAGYDLVTGLGTPKAAALIADLATSAAVTGGSASTTTGGTTATGGSTSAITTLSTIGITLLTDPLATAVGGDSGTLKVRLGNSATTTFSGPVTVTLYASTDGTTAGETRTLTATTVASLKLRGGASRVLTLRYTYPTDLATGTYYLVAAADATGTDTQATTAVTPAVAVSLPTVDLSVAFAGTTAVAVTPGKKGKVILRLANVGNVTAKGSVTVTISTSVDGAVVPLNTLTRKVKIVAGRALAFAVPFTAPTDLAAGTYDLVASIVSTTTPSDANATNDTATVATRAA